MKRDTATYMKESLGCKDIHDEQKTQFNEGLQKLLTGQVNYCLISYVKLY